MRIVLLYSYLNQQFFRMEGVRVITFCGKEKVYIADSLLHGRLGGLHDKKSIVMILTTGIGQLS